MKKRQSSYNYLKIASVSALLLVGIGIGASAQQAEQATEDGRILVELFSSQNCGACPKANQNLIELSETQPIFPITWSVDYWDYLGWKDTYAKPEFVSRQKGYADTFSLRGPYTPQTVVDGCLQHRGFSKKSIKKKIAKALKEDSSNVDIHVESGSVTLSSETPLAKGTVWLAGYIPGITSVTPEKGGNKGRTIDHTNMATSLNKLGDWKGETELSFEFSCIDQACLIMLQDGEIGEIIDFALVPSSDSEA